MRPRLLKSIGAAAALVSVLIMASQVPVVSAEAATTATVLKAAWGEPDLRGIWVIGSDMSFQCFTKYPNQEFPTAAQRGELNCDSRSVEGNYDQPGLTVAAGPEGFAFAEGTRS